MRKKHIAALAGMAAVFAVGGSLAYFNQNLEAVNVLKSWEQTAPETNSRAFIRKTARMAKQMRR